MFVLFTCKNEKALIKMKALVATRFICRFFRCSRADNSVVGGGMKFKLLLVH